MYILNGDDMKCLICKKLFFEKRTIKSLFSEEIETKCFSCREKHFIIPYEVVYPISNHLLFLTIIFISKNQLNEDAFMKEIGSALMKYMIKKHRSDIILFVEEMTEDLYNALDAFNSCDIFLISLYPPSFLV